MTLEVRGVTKRFGGLVAVDQVSLEVPAGGHIIGLMGPNGAGKTTLFNCITGYLRPEHGDVLVDGESITALKPYRRAQLGIGRTFQRLAVFDTMTVEENIQVAVEARRGGGLLRNLFGLRHRVDPEVAEQTASIVERMRLGAVKDEVVGGLSTGFGRLVELGRALATSPTYVLLDEPASGLDTNETHFLESVLRDVCASGVSLLLVEHDVDLVLRLCERIHVLDFGSSIAAGTPEEIRADASVRAAYLGGGDATEVGAGATGR